MGRIKQLSTYEAQKIAAGEVVERPANIVKELIENSLDAHATQITIYIQDAGKTSIRIVDNGIGMDRDDAHACFGHHATSKLTTIHDLASLNTFGFRGEALSSIASVSKVSLITKEAHSQSAVQLLLENAQVQQENVITGMTGTDLTISNLFYNVPARKKFLKTDDTELRHIILLFQAACLSYLSVSFKLFSQGNLIFNCPATTDVKNRIAQLWDHTIAQEVIPITIEHDHVTLNGVISNHTYTRYDRSALFFFVNNRWIKNNNLSRALLKAYLNVLPADKFPLACLSLTIDPSQVDVNIHPRKEEVQFLHPRIIESVIQQATKSALEKNLSAQLQKPISFTPTQTVQPSVSIDIPKPFASVTLDQKMQPMSNHTISLPALDSMQASTINVNFIEKPAQAFTIIGQLLKTYILIEQDENLFIVDQHAAHERILYELFSNRAGQAPIQMMFPSVIQLSNHEMQLIEPHLSLFIDNNIMVEIFGSQQLIVQAIPVHLKEVNIQEIIRQTIAWIGEEQKLETKELHQLLNKKLHAQMACKAAVKAGDILTHAQMHQLLQDLDTTENRFSCPHGRPTGWHLSKYELEKKFKRIL